LRQAENTQALEEKASTFWTSLQNIQKHAQTVDDLFTLFNQKDEQQQEITPFIAIEQSFVYEETKQEQPGISTDKTVTIHKNEPVPLVFIQNFTQEISTPLFTTHKKSNEGCVLLSLDACKGNTYRSRSSSSR
jgi:hypothetical protein